MPLRFFEVEKKELRADAAQFEETEFGVAPEALDAVDVILTVANWFWW